VGGRVTGRTNRQTVAVAATVAIEEFTGDRTDLLPSFRLADDAEQRIAAYLPLGRIWVARDAAALVGHAQAVPHGAGVWEVTNIAVAEEHHGQGIGRALLARVAEEARAAGVTRIELATAAADTGAIRFYQRCGYRLLRVVRDAFTPATGYPDEQVIDGIPLRDQLWFDRAP
jgi:ribosomal protein S18 acetylase RimI-like enzyme